MKEDKYILVDKQAVAEPDLLKWATWMAAADRQLCLDVIGENESRISTIFLGLNFAHDESSPPALFETAVFGGIYDREIIRYSTWEEAENGHREMLKKAIKAFVEAK